MKLMVIQYNEKQLFPDSVSKGETDLNSLLSYLPERVSCFARTKQLSIKNCLQDSEFLKSNIEKLLEKVANIVNSIRKSVSATTYL